MSDLGRMLKEKRKSKGLSQKRLGNACGLSDSEIMKIENGTRKKPNWENLCKIAQALDMYPFDILVAAGYASEADRITESRIHGLHKLTNKEIEIVQTFVDFMISRKEADRNSEGGHCDEI